MARTITNEVELTFGFANGSTKKISYGSYNQSDTTLTDLKTNIQQWNTDYSPSGLIVDADGSSCTGIIGATIINTVTEDVPASV